MQSPEEIISAATQKLQEDLRTAHYDDMDALVEERNTLKDKILTYEEFFSNVESLVECFKKDLRSNAQ